MSEEELEQFKAYLRQTGLDDETIDMMLSQISMDELAELAQSDEMIDDHEFFTGEKAIELSNEHQLPQNLQWAIACGANLAFHNGEFLNVLTTGLDKNSITMMLSDWWDINNKTELASTFEWLLSEGHHQSYHSLLSEYFSQIADKRCGSELDQPTELDSDTINNIDNMFEQAFANGLLKPNDTLPSLIAWDYGRLINLARFAYEVNILSEDEAFGYIVAAANMLRQSYSSWHDLSVGYLLGRYLWNEGEDFEEWHQEMTLLESDPTSPWVTLPWTLPLTQ